MKKKLLIVFIVAIASMLIVVFAEEQEQVFEEFGITFEVPEDWELVISEKTHDRLECFIISKDANGVVEIEIEKDFRGNFDDFSRWQQEDLLAILRNREDQSEINYMLSRVEIDEKFFLLYEYDDLVDGMRYRKFLGHYDGLHYKIKTAVFPEYHNAYYPDIEYILDHIQITKVPDKMWENILLIVAFTIGVVLLIILINKRYVKQTVKGIVLAADINNSACCSIVIDSICSKCHNSNGYSLSSYYSKHMKMRFYQMKCVGCGSTIELMARDYKKIKALIRKKKQNRNRNL